MTATADRSASPWLPGARDAVSALFYARTLPLTAGDELGIPVDDAGRHLAVRVRVKGTEVVPAPGGAIQTLRLRVLIERRLARRQSVAATLWLSADARRVPVRLDLSAGFGRLRAELVDYRP